jgi:hypothetical protein
MTTAPVTVQPFSSAVNAQVQLRGDAGQRTARPTGGSATTDTA